MKPFFEGKKIIYFALISYKDVKTQRHGLFVFSGAYCHQPGLWGGRLTGPQPKPSPQLPGG